jgi:hypothetical protein
MTSGTTTTDEELESRLIYRVLLQVGPGKPIGQISIYQSTSGVGYEMHIPSLNSPGNREDKLAVDEIKARIAYIVDFGLDMAVMAQGRINAYIVGAGQEARREEPRVSGVDVPDSGTVDGAQG